MCFFFFQTPHLSDSKTGFFRDAINARHRSHAKFFFFKFHLTLIASILKNKTTKKKENKNKNKIKLSALKWAARCQADPHCSALFRATLAIDSRSRFDRKRRVFFFYPSATHFLGRSVRFAAR